ncbi:RNA polymerase sigma-70 factor [Chitinophagaceae bacterium LB-8]|uniref:RNA polymerase sigma-70 factor n=1 Tax=Paraflavisolibacter caeni TaxID=2982496 RepID=A0A9X2XUN9_9BACT|nr:RNA polymerase sigma-70 factor [Paraflavisolibacter caeni]MCU7548965.1 RNA polymerase sigma-70 factor [Paraflavisolibacter caeni]
MAEAVFQIPVFQAFRMESNERELISLLESRNEAAFEHVFKSHFKGLHGYACSILKDEAAAEEMVQNVFFKLWERTGNLSLSGSLTAYLYRAVNNECLNYLKHQKVKMKHGLFVAHRKEELAESASGKLQLRELEARLQSAMNDLPEQCRMIFQLSRFEELRYREIAEQLGLSIKTVENQMGKALKILREKLADLLPAAILFLFQILKNIP